MTTISCEAGQFKKFIESIRAISEESRLHLDKEGINSIVVDQANVAMVDIKYPSSAMKMYKFNEKCPITIGIDWSKFPKLLSAAKENTPVTVNFTKDRVTISYAEIKACVKYGEEFTIRKDPNPPVMKLNGELSFDGDMLLKFGKVNVSDKVKISTKNGIASIESYGDPENHVKAVLALDIKGTFKSLYSWDYLKEISKVLKGAYISCKFDTDHPIWMTSTIKGIQVDYLLAPRIESA